MRDTPRLRLSLTALAVALLALTVPAAAQDAPGDRRVALVVGNAAYAHVSPLANPANDASLIAQTLKRLGFTVIGGGAQDNLDKARFDQAVRAFGQAIQGADVALFYYAGHGMQVQGTNWLVPVDANPGRMQDLDFQMLDAGLVLKQMDGAGTRLNILILDACRNNPFAGLGTRATAGGLAEMRAPEGTLISFATQPGNVAVDGKGADGPFALALSEVMHRPNLDLFHLFNQVGLQVKQATGNAQQPWVSTSPIDGEFYFNHTDATPDTGAAPSLFAAAEVAGDTREAAAPNGTPDTAAKGTTRPMAGAAANAGPGRLPGATPSAAVASTSSARRPISGQSPSTTAGSPPPAGASTSAATPSSGAGTDVQALRSLAAQGKPDAQTELGRAFALGQGVDKDMTQALLLFQRAAAQSYPRAQYLVGLMHERGYGGLKRSYAEALEWYRRSAAQNFPPAEFAVGRFYGHGLAVNRDLAERNTWVRRAAEHGSPLAQLILGNIYRHGWGVPADLAGATDWYRRAAEQGNPGGAVQLGRLYALGQGVPRDPAAAMHWFRLASDKGSAIGANDVGLLYRNGNGVPRDYAEAARWFRLAVDRGSVFGKLNLGTLYAEGQGVPRDKAQAITLLQQAADAGNEVAAERLARLTSEPRAVSPR